MLQSITGLYLNHINYGDTSVILKVYTSNFGAISFIVKGIKRKKGGLALLQPFHYIELTSNFKPEKELNFGNNLKLSAPTYSITSDIRKSTVSLFITEVLNKTLRESSASNELYEGIKTLITNYDNSNFSPLFHHYFLTQFIYYLGIGPDLDSFKEHKVLNIAEGLFEYNTQPDKNSFEVETSALIKTLADITYENLADLKIASITKKKLLQNLIDYIEAQTGIKKGSIKSHKILEDIFSS